MSARSRGKELVVVLSGSTGEQMAIRFRHGMVWCLTSLAKDLIEQSGMWRYSTFEGKHKHAHLCFHVDDGNHVLRYVTSCAKQNFTDTN